MKKVELEFDESLRFSFIPILPVTVEIIKQFEQDTGLKLPESYANFLLEQKCGFIKTMYEINGKEYILVHKVTFYDGEITYIVFREFSNFTQNIDQEETDEDEKLPPYSIIKYNEGGFTSEQYWDFGVQLSIGECENGDISISICLTPNENYVNY